MIADFQAKNPNIEIVLNAPPDAGTVLKTRLTKNDMPDVLSMGGDNLYGELATNKILLDLSKESFMSNIQTAYIDQMKDLLTNGDTNSYGVPYATNADGVLYNKEKFTKLGLQIHKTWNVLAGDIAPATNDTSKNKVISGVDVLLAVTKSSKHPTEAKKFIEYMLQKENAQTYITDQFAFSAVKDVVQKDERVTDLADSFKTGQIGSFPDHYYPTGLDTASIVQGFLSKKDKAVFLKQLDTEYNKNIKK